MSNIEIFEKKTKAPKGKLIAAIVLFAMCLMNELGAYMVMKGVLDDPTPLIDTEKVGEYTCVDVHGMTEYFAEYTGGTEAKQKAYFVVDDNYMYIAAINKKNLEKLHDFIKYIHSDDEDAEKPEPVQICGLAESIPTNLRKLAIDSYNEFLGEKILTTSNFESYFGKYYLNTDRGPHEDFQIASMTSGVFLVIGGIFLLVFFNDIRKTKKTLNKYANEMDTIKMEIAAPDTLYEKKARVFLTANRIINVSSGMEIYDYKDIIWVYPHELRQNGYTTQKSIYVVTKDNKAHIIANINMSKKNNILFDEIYESLMLKMPDALHGYTKENKEKVKEMTKKK